MGTILITGGTGFVGSALRQRLAGSPMRILARHPDRAGQAPSAEIVRGNVLDPPSLRNAMEDVDAVIHLVAIIAERGELTFDAIIRQGTTNVVTAAANAGVRRFIHVSTLGAQDNSAYPYLQAKWRSEAAVRSAPIDWTIARPSVMFGPGDGFITVLADLIRRAPIVPVVGDGTSKFQPVAIGDITDAIQRMLDDPGTIGKTYELGGGEIYTYEELIDLIAGHLGKSRPKVHLPVGLMKAAVALSRPLPSRLRPPVTKEQLRMLAVDNCTDQSATESLIGRPALSLRNGLDYLGK
jgi:uncharacterized protein YbjT (DUF2867 family)